MPSRTQLTERFVKAAKPAARAYQVYDAEVLGFALVVYPSGLRGFALSYRFSGQQRRLVIGRWPDWSVVAARERAKALRREIGAGGDPMADRQARQAAPTVAKLVDRYIEDHLPRLAARNASDQASMLRQMVLPDWGNRLVEEITPGCVDRLLTKVAEGRARPAKAEAPSRGKRKLKPPRATPIRANRLGEVLRKMFGLAVEWRFRADNPAGAFYRRLEVERERYLSAEEIHRLADALNAAEDQRGAAIVRLCLLSGARLGEVREARFEQFNLDLQVWTKPAARTKQRRIHRLPISADVCALVRQRRAAVGDGCAWLFPGDAPGKDQPVQDMRRFWASIRAAAELPDVRVHDLRHTFASLLVSGGASLEMIGKLLGHSQMKTTQRYAHLADQPLRLGVESVAQLVRPRPRIVD